MRKALCFLPLLAAAGLAPALAWAQSAPVQGDGVDVALQVSATQPTILDDGVSASIFTPAPVVSSQAHLQTQSGPLAAHVQLGLQTGATSGPYASGWWNSGAADVGAAFSPNSAAKLQVGATNTLRLQFDPGDPVMGAGMQRFSQSRQTGATAAATVSPTQTLSLKVGAAASGAASQSVTGAGAASTNLLQTQDRRMFAAAAWKPLDLVGLDGGAKLESTGVYWSGARAGAIAELDPNLGAAVTPWTGASWRLSLERATAPLDVNQFVGYAPVGTAPAAGGHGAMTLPPNSEWRYRAAIEQRAGAVDLTASILRANLRTYAYVAPWGPDAGHVDSGAGQRSEIDAGLAAPLPLLPGLAPLTLKASGAWRQSTAADPLTGVMGRLSGEHPYDASLSLTQALPAVGMRWGMIAQASGPTRTYLGSQVASVSASAGLGGFVEYQPGGMALQLQVDNLLGGDRDQRDTYYAGPRDLNVIDHSDVVRITDHMVRIALIRPL